MNLFITLSLLRFLFIYKSQMKAESLQIDIVFALLISKIICEIWIGIFTSTFTNPAPPHNETFG